MRDTKFYIYLVIETLLPNIVIDTQFCLYIVIDTQSSDTDTQFILISIVIAVILHNGG